MGGKGTSLRQYLLTRLLLVIPMVFILLTLVFLLMRVAPGDPISASLGGRVPAEEVERIKAELGYDRRSTCSTPSTSETSAAATRHRHHGYRPIGDIIQDNGAATLG
jgi:peptide/nickel transport system permease protein